MNSRKPLTAETLRRVAEQLAGAPVTREQAAGHTAVFEPLMTAIARLRSLPLKEIEPAVVFRPEEDES